MTLMLEAWRPFLPWVTSKETFWPSCRVLKLSAWISEKCANRSSPLSSGEMKPKPLVSLNHLTVPVAIIAIPLTALIYPGDTRVAVGKTRNFHRETDAVSVAMTTCDVPLANQLRA